MEHLWIFLIILFVIIIIALVIWYWHDHNNNQEHDHYDIALSCDQVIGVINSSSQNYHIIMRVEDKVIYNQTIPSGGESTICKPNQKCNLIIFDDNKDSVANITSDTAKSSYIFLDDNNTYYTTASAKGKEGRIYINNSTKKKAIVAIYNKTGLWQGIVHPKSDLEVTSEYLHLFQDNRQTFDVRISFEGAKEILHEGTITGSDPISIEVSRKGVIFN